MAASMRSACGQAMGAACRTHARLRRPAHPATPPPPACPPQAAARTVRLQLKRGQRVAGRQLAGLGLGRRCGRLRCRLLCLGGGLAWLAGERMGGCREGGGACAARGHAWQAPAPLVRDVHNTAPHRQASSLRAPPFRPAPLPPPPACAPWAPPPPRAAAPLAPPRAQPRAPGGVAGGGGGVAGAPVPTHALMVRGAGAGRATQRAAAPWPCARAFRRARALRTPCPIQGHGPIAPPTFLQPRAWAPLPQGGPGRVHEAKAPKRSV